MKKQVSQTMSACSFYLRNINHISRFLPRQTKERVVNAIIISRLDYCNALLYGTSAVNIARLQRIHNTAAGLIMRSPCSDSATPLLRELHWLPIVCRVDFKLLVFTYKDTTTRQCICVNSYQPTRTLRSANYNMLEVKRTRTKAGDCSFAVAAASLWSNLTTVIKTSDNLTSFKRLLKTIFLVLHISVIRHEHYFFSRLFGNIINTYIIKHLLALLLRNYYYFTVLTYTKLFIANNNYTYTVIYQYHSNVIIQLYYVFL
ncbi:hypothetical protein NP493_236g02005 [Ridgeia piscesae]|uniref:Uncharacterized protein n=1 Tax=Ridgeia piscesae TaxID=27915 RepID=A0AAD9NZS7_RIDPI|nr:hypothetical protein NP493_236g02005 [Ridgeia piscesae]